MKKINSVLLLTAILVSLVNSWAQTDNNSANRDNTAKRSISSIPYSAEATSETTQTLADGNKVRTTTKELIYSDGKGRVRRETEYNFGRSLRKTVNIRDQQAGFEYYLNPITKTAYRAPIKTFSANTQKVAPLPSGYKSNFEPLGSKDIEGFEATGNRIVTSIPAGMFGNEQPIETVSENWYVSVLQAIVLSKTTDPRYGDKTYEMKNIKRIEPDSGLFTVPEDYKIVDDTNPTNRYFSVESAQ